MPSRRRKKMLKQAAWKKAAEKAEKEKEETTTTDVNEEEEAPVVKNRQTCEQKCKNKRGTTSRIGCLGGCRQKYPKYVDHPVYGRLRY